MFYKEYLPNPSLQNIVEYYWHTVADLAATVTQDFSTPLLQGMAFNLKHKMREDLNFEGKTIKLCEKAYLIGQPVQHRVSVNYGGSIDLIGVKFKPLGIYQLTGIHMKHIANQVISAEAIWGNEINLICEQMYEAVNPEHSIRILEDFFIKKLSSGHSLSKNPYVAHTLYLLDLHQGNINIKSILNQTNTTKKTLERAFSDQLGVLPKLYSRISRYNLAKQHIEQSGHTNWHEIIYRFGYYDQAHFINEFKHFSGKTPSEFLRPGIQNTDGL